MSSVNRSFSSLEYIDITSAIHISLLVECHETPLRGRIIIYSCQIDHVIIFRRNTNIWQNNQPLQNQTFTNQCYVCYWSLLLTSNPWINFYLKNTTVHNLYFVSLVIFLAIRRFCLSNFINELRNKNGNSCPILNNHSVKSFGSTYMYEMFVTSYSVNYCIYIPGKPEICFH